MSESCSWFIKFHEINRLRTKTFNEALSVFNKFFPSVPSKKRSRSESFSSDRSNSLLSNDRSVLGPSFGKMGVHNHAVSGGGFELEPQKSEERTKNVVPNKRTRTSLVDVRVCNLYTFLYPYLVKDFSIFLDISFRQFIMILVTMVYGFGSIIFYLR